METEDEAILQAMVHSCYRGIFNERLMESDANNKDGDLQDEYILKQIYKWRAF